MDIGRLFKEVRLLRDNIQTTLKYCLEITRRGESKISVFDLLYETGFTYPELQSALATLAERKLIIQTDKKTVEYIGEGQGEEVRLSEIDTMLANIKTTDDNFLSVLEDCYDGLNEAKQILEYNKRQGGIDGEDLKKFEEVINNQYNRLKKMREQYVQDKQSKTVDSANFMDETYIKALGFCVRRQQVSTSLIQRHFPVGYLKACQIVDWMEGMGYITPPDGCKPRSVLIDNDEFERIYGGIFDNKAFELGELFKDDHDGDGEDDDDLDDFDIDSLFKRDTDSDEPDSADGEEPETKTTARDPAEDLASIFTEELKGTFKWGRNPRGVVVYSDSFKFSTGDSVQFRIICKEEGVFLSDEGFIRNTLAARSHFGYTRADKKIEKYIQGKRAEYRLGELRIDVNIYTVFNDYMYLYSLIEGLLAN